MGNVAIWTQAYNAEKTLRRTMDCVLNQTYSDWEYHILDNGSTDSTGEIISQYAHRDARIIKHQVDVNDINTHPHIRNAIKNTSAKWFVWLDADDEYTTDFLEKMVTFAESEQLDVAACGYEKIDSVTDAVIKRKAIDRSIVIAGTGFADKFIDYRGFTAYFWAKLVSFDVISRADLFKDVHWSVCGDSARVLRAFQYANRAGVHSGAMYKYYQYPSSVSRKFKEEYLENFDSYWYYTKEYIESYGEVSRLNEDFLYAIYLSLMDEVLNLIYASAHIVSEKLEYIKRVFTNPLATETFARDADPVFQNLSQRSEFAQSVTDRITAWEDSGVGEAVELIKKFIRPAVSLDKELHI